MRRVMWMVPVTLGLVLLVGACKSKPTVPAGPQGGTAATGEAGATQEGPSALDSAQQYLLESGQRDIREAKEALGRGEDPKFKCVAVNTAATKLRTADDPAAKAFVREADQSCGFEIPLAWAQLNVGRMDKVRKERPTETFLTECVDVSMALDDLGLKHGEDAEVMEIKKRYDALCETP